VSCLRASQGDPVAAGAVAGYLALCLRHLDAGRIRLVVVGGLPGIGKSTVAAGVESEPPWARWCCAPTRSARS
jgi:uncharacterized protein